MSTEETNLDGVVLDEPPASPVADDDRSGSSFVEGVTRVRMELEEKQGDQIISGGVGFTIDCVGTNTSRTTNNGSEDTDEIEVVGALSSQPCCSSSIRNNKIHGTSKVSNVHGGSGYGDQSIGLQDLPLYDVESNIIIKSVTSLAAVAVKTQDTGRKKNSCWNCDGDHMISNCPEQRNHQKITENRKKFMATKTNNSNNYCNNSYESGGRNRRYHEEASQRQVKPGQLSEELRYVMGLEAWQLPEHIYKMRVYGYPPGWLDNAMEEATSGLKLYGDNITLQLGASRRETRLNPDQIISYPGFNAPIPEGFVDESRELGLPRFSEDDSIESMMKRLTTNSIQKKNDDGIVSQESSLPSGSAEKWEFNSLAGLDKPVMNDGGRYGSGRGRYKEPERRTLKPGHNANFGTSNRTEAGIMVGNQRLRIPVERVIESEVQTIDERYLPTQLKNKKSNKRPLGQGRSSSPSLLGVTCETDIDLRSPDSPVILNMPPVVEVLTARDVFSSDEDTGSSDAFGNSCPNPKRRRVEAADSDDDVMIIATDEENESEKSDDSVCVLMTPNTSSAAAKPLPSSKQVLNSSTSVDKPSISKTVPDVVELDSPTSPTLNTDSGSDWETNEPSKRLEKPEKVKRKVIVPVPVPVSVPSPGSSTGDEGDMNFTENSNEMGHSNGATSQASDDVANSAANDDSCSSQSVQEVASIVKPKEFIPSNPRLEAIKKRLIAHEEEDDGEPKNSSFNSLPSFEKFAQGMPAMVFEEEPPERTGRLDRVLNVLKNRKNAMSKAASSSRGKN